MACRLLLLFSFLLFVATHSFGETPVKVGVIMGFTGSFAPIAEEMRRGMEIAAQESPELKLVFEDDHGMDNKSAVNAFTRLAAVERAPLVLSWVNTTMPAIAPLAQRYRVPVIEFWDSNRAMLKLGDYVFCSGTSTEKASMRMAGFVHGPQQVKRLALIVANDPWSELAAGTFAEEFKKRGGTIVYEARINPDEQDVKAVLVKARAAGAEGLFAPLFFNALYNTIQQARDLGFTGKIFTADGFAETDIEILKEAAQGVYSLQTVVDSREFLSLYSAKHGAPKSKVQLGYAALAYDGVKIAAAAVTELRRGGKEVSGPALRDVLKTMRYDGISGAAVLAGESEKVERVVRVAGATFEPVE